MYRIVKNVCYDEYRKKKSSKEISYESLLEDQEEGLAWIEKRMPIIEPTRGASVDMAFLKKVLHQSMDKLSKNHKEVLLLFAEEDLSYSEIAERTNCSVGTVMSRLFYARKKAKKHYKAAMAKVFSLTKEE
jgi:RNA polymerase sigma-70 factor (ECF subfamily)